jgi:hypothetical protein
MDKQLMTKSGAFLFEGRCVQLNEEGVGVPRQGQLVRILSDDEIEVSCDGVAEVWSVAEVSVVLGWSSKPAAAPAEPAPKTERQMLREYGARQRLRQRSSDVARRDYLDDQATRTK